MATMRNRVNSALSLLFASLLILCFQNCSPAGFELKGDAALSSQNDAQGTSPSPTPSPSPTATVTPVPTVTPRPTATPIPTATPTITPTPTPPVTPTPTPTPVATGKKTVIMASGHMGRSVMSCDGGYTWIRDRSDNAATKCWVDGDPNYFECDHSPSAGRGMDYGDGYFYTNYGWGFDGSIRRSKDGVNWTTVRTGGWGAGVAYVNGVIFSAWGDWSYSSNLGQSWTMVASAPNSSLDHPVFRHVGNKIFGYGYKEGLALSRTQGMTWEYYPNIPITAGIAEGNGSIVVVGGLGNVSVSRDDGKSWSSYRPFSNANFNSIVFNGSQFVAWSDSGLAWRSNDGTSWTSSSVQITGSRSAGQLYNPVAYNPETKTYVAIPNIWGNYYSAQKAYVSTNGTTWTELSSTAFKGGHPLGDITVGTINASDCP